MKDTRSKELYERAKVHIPGGVNSPVRAFRAVNRTPRFMESAKGDRILTPMEMNISIMYVHGDLES